ncbi:hypothetical protein [Jatrophihabitans sp.]|uniref:hypothetical protein n=1 Tax=Jatrophihabitans sp. TaxID=1932789 RepID=UPI0030C6690F
MKVRYSVAGIAAAAVIAAVLTGCGSSGGGPPGLPLTQYAPAPTTSAAKPAATHTVTPPKITAAAIEPAKPVQVGRSDTSFPSVSTPSVSHATSKPEGAPALSSPVTFRSAGFASFSNCSEAGTSYYKPPNISVGMDVTVLAASQQLADGLDITPPNAALRGMSNASTLRSSKALGHGVWQATYRVYTSLYEPDYTPVTISSLRAAAAGSGFTIDFSSPVTVTESDCHT